MTRSKIDNVRKKPVAWGPQRDRMIRTLAAKVFGLYQDAEQRELFQCVTTLGAKRRRSCIAGARKGGNPEDYHALVLDERLCGNCRTNVAFHLASVRLRTLAGMP